MIIGIERRSVLGVARHGQDTELYSAGDIGYLSRIDADAPGSEAGKGKGGLGVRVLAAYRTPREGSHGDRDLSSNAFLSHEPFIGHQRSDAWFKLSDRFSRQER